MSYGIWLNENSDNRIDLWVPRATLEKKGKLATDYWHLQPYTYTTDVNTHYKLIATKKEKSCYDQEFKPEPPPKNRQRKKEECKWLCRVHSIVLYWTAEVLLKTPRSSTTCTSLLEGLYDVVFEIILKADGNLTWIGYFSPREHCLWATTFSRESKSVQPKRWLCSPFSGSFYEHTQSELNLQITM